MENAIAISEKSGNITRENGIIEQQNRINLAMLEQMREMTDRIGELEREVRRLRLVTPNQVKALNAALHERAAELCRSYRCTGAEKTAAAEIRRAVKLTCGASRMGEISRQDYETAMRQIALWDDFAIMRKIRGQHGTV